MLRAEDGPLEKEGNVERSEERITVNVVKRCGARKGDEECWGGKEGYVLSVGKQF